MTICFDFYLTRCNFTKKSLKLCSCFRREWLLLECFGSFVSVSADKVPLKKTAQLKRVSAQQIMSYFGSSVRIYSSISNFGDSLILIFSIFSKYFDFKW